MTKLIVDCDPGHDDAFAILYAAHHLDLLAVTTVFGNQRLSLTTWNALRLLTLAGLDVPVYQGCERPLIGEAVHAGDIHGESGLDGAELPEPDRATEPDHAVDLLIEMAHRHQGELVIAAVGPLTNVALALRREPRMAQWLRALTIMGGSTTHGNMTPAAEFNIYCDPEAAAIAFASGVPIHMVGLNVTRRVGLTAADAETLAASGKRTATAMAGLVRFYLERQRQTFGLDSGPLHDPCALVPYVQPGLIRYREVHVEVELAGNATRGMTVCDLRGARREGLGDIRVARAPNAQVAIEADARPIIDGVLAAVLAYA